MAKMTIRKGDTVEILSGKDKGVRGEVLRAMPSEGKIVVAGVAMVKKTQRPDQQNQTGGIVTKESAIDVSRAMLVCPKCDKATRVGHATSKDGKKVRVCKKCGAEF